jgi:hypothetical protein
MTTKEPTTVMRLIANHDWSALTFFARLPTSKAVITHAMQRITTWLVSTVQALRDIIFKRMAAYQTAPARNDRPNGLDKSMMCLDV